MRAALVILGLLSASCASTRMRDAMTELQDSVEAYNEAFRWKNFERASLFVPADLRSAFIATYEDDENSLHVEDYQITAVKMENEKSAIVNVRVRYMLLPSISVEKASLVQHWRKINETWTLETEEGSIRELAVDKQPRNPEAVGKEPPPEDPNAKSAVQVEDPKGNVLRKDEAFGEDDEDDD